MIKSLKLLTTLLVVSKLSFGQSAECEFPETPNPGAKYLFYLHGAIVENEGRRPTSEEFGIYEYDSILIAFKNYGFNVISEERPKNTNAKTYATKIVAQIEHLIQKQVPEENIAVVGASKGAYIAMVVSSILSQPNFKFVLLGACKENTFLNVTQQNIQLCGNFLSIYEQSDELGQTCDDFFKAAKCLTSSNEIMLTMHNGHGFLYKPYPEWIKPTVSWIKNHR